MMDDRVILQEVQAIQGRLQVLSQTMELNKLPGLPSFRDYIISIQQMLYVALDVLSDVELSLLEVVPEEK